LATVKPSVDAVLGTTVSEPTTNLRKLVLAAQVETDFTRRFALLDTARRQAAAVLDLRLLRAVLLLIGRDYRIDDLQEYVTDLDRLRQAGKATEQHVAVAKAALETVNDAVARRRFDVATKLLNIAASAATVAKDQTVAKAITARRAVLSQENRDYLAYRRAMQTLQQRGDDPTASLAVGRFSVLSSAIGTLGCHS